MSATQGESTFEKALNSWTAVKLPELQTELDNKSNEIQQMQTQTLESRKQLAANTKSFKKLDDEDKLTEFKALLKQYQGEIDALTNRAKLSESAFYHVYRSISELPDPKPLLEVSIDSVIASQEAEELKVKNAELNNELLKYADYDQLKAKLLRLEQKSAETLTNRLKLKEEELKAVFEDKEAHWREKEEDLQKKLKELEKQNNELETQQKIDKLKLKNQRIALGEDPDEDEDQSENITVDDHVVSRRELESLQKEVQTKDIKITQLFNKNQELIKELKVAKSDVAAQEAKFAQELKLNELESENVTLVAQLDNIKHQMDSFKKTNQSTLNNLKRDLKFSSDENVKLRSTLNNYKDYEDIKQELATLRSVSFGGFDNQDDDEEEEDDDKQDPVKSSSNQLDEILVTRNKKLTSEVAEYRAKHEELNTKISTLSNQLTTSTQEIESLKRLNNQLENDLTALQSNGAYGNFDTMSMLSGVSKFTSKTKKLSPASSIAGGQLQDIQEDHQGTNNSVLPIITSQRDRFRSRNVELESQLKRQNNIITELRSEINKLKKQNTDLFEKTRYLSSFQKGAVKRFDAEKQTSYEANYEESLHPLAKFRQREQERVASKLSALERVFLGFAKAILANKTSRMLFLGYCVGLHCLVMAMSFYVMSLHGSLTPDVGGHIGQTIEKTSNTIP